MTQGAHGTVTFTATSVTFTPTANYNGSIPSHYTISARRRRQRHRDRQCDDHPANDAPDAVNDAATTAEDTAKTITVLSNDTDPENDSLSVTAVTQGAHGTVTFTTVAPSRLTPAANYNGSIPSPTPSPTATAAPPPAPFRSASRRSTTLPTR